VEASGNTFTFRQCDLMGVLIVLRLMAFSSVLLGVYIAGRCVAGRSNYCAFLMLGVFLLGVLFHSI
jgi:hypothetical protein